MKTMKLYHLCFLLLAINSSLQVVYGRVQQTKDTEYAVAGESITLPCSVPNNGDFLKWWFQPNDSSTNLIDAAHFFPGGTVSIFEQFDLPPGRSQLINGMFKITQLTVQDEGHYWCEISSASAPTTFSDKTPVHIWVTPQEPQIIPIGNGTVLEHTKTTVARCSSRAGKPEATLTWMNGSEPLVTSAQPLVSKNSFSDYLWDIELDLILEDPTRFDHKRPFQCLIEHPAYKGEIKKLNHSVNVLYHPVNIRIWANTTSLYVYCEADGYPAPSYTWVLPGDIDSEGPELLMSDLYDLPGTQWFECTADNGIPDPAVARILVDDLRWPNGKPPITFAGLELWIWLIIAGSVVLLIIVTIIAICCYCKRKKKGAGYNAKKNKSASKYNKPIVTASGASHSQPSLLEFNSMRTPDGREAARPSSEYSGTKKSSMGRSYSLEHLVEEKYGGPPDRNSVMLVPLNKPLSRENLYADSSLNRRASREEIDKVADHIEVLNKSWDNLAHSRDQLNTTREGLHVDLPPQYSSQDDLRNAHNQYGSRERPNDQDSYPYMDDTVDRRNDRPGGKSNAFDNRNYYQHIIPDQRYNYDGNAADNYRDDRQHGGGANNYNDRSYDDRYYDQQRYDDRYNSNTQYDGQQHGYNDQNYNQQYYDDRNRNPSYGSEFDDDDRNYGYDQRGYQPARIV
ncbi:uncharacterized protein LOC143461289 isoform X2 [Clavelina lepadiformis]|uniref:uncharacterized protein LOC143461289 isoform X2 n=1 Tax=Clavelina lepadiformis TaxID=159417 RepID=UPI00404342DC